MGIDMKKVILLATALAMISGSALAADLPVKAKVPAPAPFEPWDVAFGGALMNDYIFRGITQSATDPAIQGGLDWDSGAGFYLGTWGSSIEFGNDASMELDLYGGYRGSIDNFTYDVGFLYYAYPSTAASGLDFWEVYGKAGYNFGTKFTGSRIPQGGT